MNILMTIFEYNYSPLDQFDNVNWIIYNFFSESIDVYNLYSFELEYNIFSIWENNGNFIQYFFLKYIIILFLFIFLFILVYIKVIYYIEYLTYFEKNMLSYKIYFFIVYPHLVILFFLVYYISLANTYLRNNTKNKYLQSGVGTITIIVIVIFSIAGFLSGGTPDNEYSEVVSEYSETTPEKHHQRNLNIIVPTIGLQQESVCLERDTSKTGVSSIITSISGDSTRVQLGLPFLPNGGPYLNEVDDDEKMVMEAYMPLCAGSNDNTKLEILITKVESGALSEKGFELVVATNKYLNDPKNESIQEYRNLLADQLNVVLSPRKEAVERLGIVVEGGPARKEAPEEGAEEGEGSA